MTQSASLFIDIHICRCIDFFFHCLEVTSRARWPLMLYFMVQNTNLSRIRWPPPPLAAPLLVCGHPQGLSGCSPCLHSSPLVPVLVRHGGHSMSLPLRPVYARLFVLRSINSLTGSVLKNCNTATSNGTSFP